MVRTTALLSLAAALLAFAVWLLWYRVAPESSPATPPDGTGPAAVATEEARADADTGEAAERRAEDEASARTSRTEIAAATTLRGAFRTAEGGWPEGGEAELFPWVEPPADGMLSMLNAGLDAARDSGGGGRQQFESWLGLGEPIATAPLADDGTFQFDAPEPGRYRIGLRHATLRRADEDGATFVEVIASRAADAGLLLAVPAPGLLLLVADRSGAPIRGAEVRLSWPGDPSSRFGNPRALQNLPKLLRESIPREETTDERGAARLFGLDGPDWDLRVTVANRPPHFADLHLVPGRDHVERVILEDGATLVATVRDAGGRPVADAEVRLAFPDLRDRRPAVGVGGTPWQVRRRTDEAGRAEIRGLPLGRTEYRVHAADHVPHRGEAVVGADGANMIDVVLADGAAVSGCVVDEDGAPIEGARVVHLPMLGESILGMDLSSIVGLDVLALEARRHGALSAADGSFRLGGLDRGESVPLVAVADGHRPGRTDAAAGDTGVELRLLREGRVEGRVVADADGAPVPSFRVELRQRAFMIADRAITGADVASEDGAFAIGGAPRDRAVLAIAAPGFAEFTQSIDLSAGTVDAGELRLLEPAAVAGRVIDENGAPVGGADVRVARGGFLDAAVMSGVFGGRGVQTSTDGSFRVEELAGTAVRLIVDKDGFATAKSSPIRIEPGTTTGDVVVALSRGGRVVGFVVDVDGGGLGGFRVQCASADGSTMRFAESAADGSFALEGLAPGAYKVDAMPADMHERLGWQPPTDPRDGFDLGGLIAKATRLAVSERAVVRDGEDTEIELVFEEEVEHAVDPGAGAVTGSVTVGGRPLDGGVVWLQPLGGATQRHLATVAAGRFRVDDVPPGSYRVEARRNAIGGAIGTARTVRVPRGGELEIDLAFPGGRIEGRVLRADGAPAPTVFVALSTAGSEVEQGTGASFGEGAVMTDERGAFAFDGLAEGGYELLARPLAPSGAAQGSGRATVSLGAGAELTGVVVRLGEAGSLRVTVRDGAGPRANAIGTLLGAGGAPLNLLAPALTDAGGIIAFDDVPAGDYRVAVDAPGAASALTGVVHVTAGDVQRTDVVLERGVEVRVALDGDLPDDLRGDVVAYTVRTGDGVPVRSGRVPIDALGSTKAASLGRLRPGPYRVRISSRRFGVVTERVEVPAGGAFTFRVAAPQ